MNEANEQPEASTTEPVQSDTQRSDASPGDATDEALDLGTIERDLAGVEAALRRLDDGTYWTDEITGDPIPDEVLAANPVTRRAG